MDVTLPSMSESRLAISASAPTDYQGCEKGKTTPRFATQGR
jgi:hypothetical protein